MFLLSSLPSFLPSLPSNDPPPCRFVPIWKYVHVHVHICAYYITVLLARVCMLLCTHMHLQTRSSTIFWHFISHSSSLPPPSSLTPLTGCPSLVCTSYLPLSLLSSLTAQTQSYGHLVLKCGHTNEVSFSSGSSH